MDSLRTARCRPRGSGGLASSVSCGDDPLRDPGARPDFVARPERRPLRPSFASASWVGLAKEALPFAIAIAVASTYFRVAVILVSLLLTAEETGYFAASYRVIEVLAVIPQLLIGAAFPILARAAASDSERFPYGVRRLFEASLLFGAWVALSRARCRPRDRDHCRPDFDPAATVLRIQGVAMLASFIAVLWSYALLGLRRHGDLLLMTAVPLSVTTVLTSCWPSRTGRRELPSQR